MLRPRPKHGCGMERKPPLAQRIEEAVEKSGLKHAEIADALGVSRPIVTQWCQGARAPRRDNLLALAKVLDVSVTWLQEGVHVLRVEDPQLADLFFLLRDAPLPVRDAVATLLRLSGKAHKTGA